VSGCGVGGNGPCAAVNEKSGNVRGGDRHRDMVAQLSGVRSEESKGYRQNLIGMNDPASLAHVKNRG
jgi:hypothetical protein